MDLPTDAKMPYVIDNSLASDVEMTPVSEECEGV